MAREVCGPVWVFGLVRVLGPPRHLYRGTPEGSSASVSVFFKALASGEYVIAVFSSVWSVLIVEWACWVDQELPVAPLGDSGPCE